VSTLTYSRSDLADLAKEAAGNWRKFQCFAWHERPDNPEDWCIVYTSNRDSGLLDQSNAHAIEQELERFTDPEDLECCGATDDDGSLLPDVRSESHSHWACGHVDRYAIRVYGPEGTITAAFAKWCELQARLEDYPVLDESDYSERELVATEENIGNAAHYAASKYDVELPDDHVGLMWRYFWDHNQSAIENRDDQGGYPSDEECYEAFRALGWTDPEMTDGILTLQSVRADYQANGVSWQTSDRTSWQQSLYRPDGSEVYLGQRVIDCARYHVWSADGKYACEATYLAQRVD
jgi:hypothetical protein